MQKKNPQTSRRRAGTGAGASNANLPVSIRVASCCSSCLQHVPLFKLAPAVWPNQGLHYKDEVLTRCLQSFPTAIYTNNYKLSRSVRSRSFPRVNHRTLGRKLLPTATWDAGGSPASSSATYHDPITTFSIRRIFTSKFPIYGIN